MSDKSSGGGAEKRKYPADDDISCGDGEFSGFHDGEAGSSIKVRRSQRIRAKNENNVGASNGSLIKGEPTVLTRVISLLPPELISHIVSFFSVSDLKRFRVICLQYKGLAVLYDAVTEEIQKRCVLRIFLRLWDDYYAPYLHVIKKSSLNLCLKFGSSHVENMDKLAEMIEECHERISQVSFKGSARKKIFETFLPKFKKLQKFEEFESGLGSLKKKELVNDNSETLEYLNAVHLDTSGGICDNQFNDLPKLTKIKLIGCTANLGLRSLFVKAVKLNDLTLSNMNIDADTAEAAVSGKNLKKLRLSYCKGEIGTLLTQAASNILTLDLMSVDMSVYVGKPFTKLTKITLYNCTANLGSRSLFVKAAKLNDLTLDCMIIDADTAEAAVSGKNLNKLSLIACGGEIGTLLTQAASKISTLHLASPVDTSIDVGKPFTNLKVFRFNGSDVDISTSPLLTRPGKLCEFFTKK